jgi:hypothetical protein
MQKRTLILISFCILLPGIIFSQEEEDKLKITFSGFIRSDIFYDSRQTVASREGYFNFFPKPVEYDFSGEDINDKSRLTMLSISTRLTTAITGPKVLGARSSAMVEADFFGHSETDINGLRLRHAYTRLNWEKAELLLGQYWNPMFLTECLPGTVSFNSGAPFHPFARNPQVRFTYKPRDLGFMLAALSQRDYVSSGPNGPGAEYIRNTGLPEMQIKLYYQKLNSENNTEFLAGAGAGYKVIQPGLFQNFSIPGTPPSFFRVKTDEKVSAKSFHLFFKASGPKQSFKSQFVLGENLHDILMLGGYAVKNWVIFSIPGELWKYSATRTASLWFSYQYNLNRFEPGLFAGYTRNLGTVDEIKDLIPEVHYFGRGYNIDYVYRISPRVFYAQGNIKFGAEIEHTAVAYGNNWDKNFKVLESEEVSNTRILITVTYFF